MRDVLAEAAVIVGGLVLAVLLLLGLLVSGCNRTAGHASSQLGAPRCGQEQAVDVWIEDAAECAALDGAVIYDERLASVRVMATAPGCALYTNSLPAAGARDAAVLWGALCPEQPLGRLRLLTLAVTPSAPLTVWPVIEHAVDAVTVRCGAWSWPVDVACE